MCSQSTPRKKICSFISATPPMPIRCSLSQQNLSTEHQLETINIHSRTTVQLVTGPISDNGSLTLPIWTKVYQLRHRDLDVKQCRLSKSSPLSINHAAHGQALDINHPAKVNLCVQIGML